MGAIMTTVPHRRPSESSSRLALHRLLDKKAAAIPGALAYRFLSDGERVEELLTYQELTLEARLLASALIRQKATGQPVILSHPPGVDELDLDGLREFLTELLPVYMLPSDICVTDSFPLDSNGKVDVARLPSPENPPQALSGDKETEQKLAGIWSELLERVPVYRKGDWFHSGGHSLLALRLFVRIHKDFRISLPLSAILKCPTLCSLASMIDESGRPISVAAS